MKQNMKTLLQKMLAAVSGAVLAASAAGVLPAFADAEQLYPEEMPAAETLVLLGETKLGEHGIVPMQFTVDSLGEFDTFYVTAKETCAAQEICITVLQEGYSVRTEKYMEIRSIEETAIVALGDAAFRFQLRHSETDADTEFLNELLTVSASVTKPYDPDFFPAGIKQPENPELTIRLYGSDEKPDPVPTEHIELLTQTEFCTQTVPEASILTQNVFAYADFSLDAGADFQQTDIRPILNLKYTWFSNQFEEGSKQLRSYGVWQPDVPEKVPVFWEDGAFRCVHKLAIVDEHLPKCSTMRFYLKDVPESDSLFRMKLGGSAILDKTYDAFEISVSDVLADAVIVKYSVMKSDHEAPLSSGECRLTLSGGKGSQRITDLEAPEGTFIVVDAMETIQEQDGQSVTKTCYAGDVRIRGVQTLNQTAEQQLGDVNGSGDVDVSDAVLLARFVAEDPDVRITEAGKRNADCNQNGQPDSEDVILILQYIAKLIPKIG